MFGVAVWLSGWKTFYSHRAYQSEPGCDNEKEKKKVWKICHKSGEMQGNFDPGRK